MAARIILITGANGGLGTAMAENFLLESADNFVLLGVHSRRDQADDLAKKHETRSAVVPLDVTDRAAWNQTVKDVTHRHGRLDVLVNNAGCHDDALLATLSQESWDRVINTNLNSTFHGCQAVLPAMISQRHGRIINIASLSALLAPAGQANYAAAKAGTVALTQSLAKEVARIGITVNAVCPGYIETGAVDSFPPDARAAALSRIPMRRFGRPAEVASLVRFLACPEASYITGSIVKIDGGIF